MRAARTELIMHYLSRTSTAARVALLAGALGACGGPQPATGGSGDGGEERREERRQEDSGPVGPTEEELARQRAEEAANAFQAAVDLYNAGTVGERDYARIEELLQSAIENNPAEPDLWYNIGILHEEQGDRAGAIEAYERAGSMEELYARHMARMGFLQLVEGDEAGARATFLACVERNPTEPGCNINLSILERRDASADGDFSQDEATDVTVRLRYALGGDALNADAYVNLALAYFELGQTQLARLVCENAILLGIEAPVLHNRLGLIALAQDDVIVAYGEFQRAVALDPAYVDAHMNIGAMALSFRDYDMAKRSFEAVIEQRPDDLEAHMAYGVALRGVDDYDGAEREYRLVLDQRPGDLAALYNLGILFQEYVQNYPRAVEWYDQYMSADPGGSSEKYSDVERRRGILVQLIEIMEETGENPYAPREEEVEEIPEEIPQTDAPPADGSEGAP